MKFEKITLHIGWPKTGSTSIQASLMKHRKSLLVNEKILYPASLEKLSHTSLASIFSESPEQKRVNLALRNLPDKETISLADNKLKHHLQQELENTDAKTVIFSSEALVSALRKKTEVEALINWCKKYTDNVQVLAFVRDPVSWSSSMAQQTIKSGKTLHEVLEKPSFPSYKNGLSRWSSVVGKEAITVLAMEGLKSHEHGLWGMFCDSVGISPNWYKQNPVVWMNESLSVEAVYIASALNKIRPIYIPDGKPNSRRYRGDVKCLMKISGSKFRLPENVLDKQREKIITDLLWLEEEYGISYSLDEKKENTPNEHITGKDIIFSDESISSLAELISDLLNENRSLR